MVDGVEPVTLFNEDELEDGGGDDEEHRGQGLVEHAAEAADADRAHEREHGDDLVEQDGEVEEGLHDYRNFDFP